MCVGPAADAMASAVCTPNSMSHNYTVMNILYFKVTRADVAVVTGYISLERLQNTVPRADTCCSKTAIVDLLHKQPNLHLSSLLVLLLLPPRAKPAGLTLQETDLTAADGQTPGMLHHQLQ
jgi:hypothetical protein